MVELMNLIISWLISVVITAVIGYFYAKKKYSGKKKTVVTEKTEPTEVEIYERKKREREELNFWSYDGTEQSDDSTAL